MKPAEIFEGENSSLRKAYDRAVEPITEIVLLDYKGGKHYIYQDANRPLDFMDYVVGHTTKEEILKDKAGIESHKESCLYYGIPAYFGDDEELRSIFK